jgi:hypothetical protein
MRKVAVVVVGLMLMAAGVAQANVFIGWTATGGFVWSGGSGILAGGGSTIAQLLWSPDNVVSPAGLGGTATEGESVLMELTLTEGVGGIDEWAWWTVDVVVDDGGANPAGGYVYGRIFQDDTVELDDYVYNGPVIAASDLNPSAIPPPTAQSYNMNRNTTLGDDIDGAYASQVVPEPATLSLLALGAMVIGLRRRRS